MAASLSFSTSRNQAQKTSEQQIEDDIVTRLQTNLDQLATQFYASVRYLSTHHPLLDFDGTPLNEATGLPLYQNNRQAQTPGGPTTPGLSSNLTDVDATGQEKKSKKDKKDKVAKDDTEGPEPAAKPPLSPDWTPLEPDPFSLDLEELADDLITKQKQIEELLNLLPRELQKEELRQDETIRQLIHELEGLEAGVDGARRERDLLLARVEGVIEGVGQRGGG